jgi:hypothetical protein
VIKSLIIVLFPFFLIAQDSTRVDSCTVNDPAPLRDAPKNQGGKKLVMIPKGERVALIGYQGDYIMVKWDEYEGIVHKAFLDCPIRAKRPEPKPEPSIYRYGLIDVGMSLEEVWSILGWDHFAGKTQESETTVGRWKTYRWESSDRIVIVTLLNGKVYDSQMINR